MHTRDVCLRIFSSLVVHTPALPVLLLAVVEVSNPQVHTCPVGEFVAPKMFLRFFSPKLHQSLYVVVDPSVPSVRKGAKSATSTTTIHLDTT